MNRINLHKKLWLLAVIFSFIILNQAIMKTNDLFLTIKKEYFNSILSGEKTEEIRIASTYFENRLLSKKYDTITLQNGYNKNSPRLAAEFLDLDLREINHEFFESKPALCFVIKIGKILQTKNV